MCSWRFEVNRIDLSPEFNRRGRSVTCIAIHTGSRPAHRDYVSHRDTCVCRDSPSLNTTAEPRVPNILDLDRNRTLPSLKNAFLAHQFGIIYKMRMMPSWQIALAGGGSFIAPAGGHVIATHLKWTHIIHEHNIVIWKREQERERESEWERKRCG